MDRLPTGQASQRQQARQARRMRARASAVPDSLRKRSPVQQADRSRRFAKLSRVDKEDRAGLHDGGHEPKAHRASVERAKTGTRIGGTGEALYDMHAHAVVAQQRVAQAKDENFPRFPCQRTAWRFAENCHFAVHTVSPRWLSHAP